ncbi:type VI secretion system baseplate subunit TssF [Vibrio sp.]|nr:type VI secretion system baseplate subunit TssF [Vibrio sp.]
MASGKYFQDELRYLKEMGSEFAKHNPKLAHFLADDAYDPDVERLLEGFAFLSGRLREKIDDELPELTQSMMTLLWPHYMRSIPSMCITQMNPDVLGVTSKRTIKKGKELFSPQVEGVQCRFKTSYDVDVYPISISSIAQHSTSTSSTIDMTVNSAIANNSQAGVNLATLGLDTLRCHLSGSVNITRSLYVWLLRHLKHIVLDVEGGQKHVLSPDKVKPVGFDDTESLLPFSKHVFSGYRLLQEYFAMPEKFMFFDLQGLEGISEVPICSGFKVSFVFDRPLPDDVIVRNNTIRLHCSPAVNLFTEDADPIRMEQRAVEYPVKAQNLDLIHHEVYSVDSVECWSKTTRQQKTLVEFESFEHSIYPNKSQDFYRTKIAERADNNGLQRFISFHKHDQTQANLEADTVLMSLTCSNGSLPERLSVGDIKDDNTQGAEKSECINITKPTQSLRPQLSGELQWQLIANMSLNYMTMADINALKTLIATYDFQSNVNRQTQRISQRRLEGLKAVDILPIDRIYRGVMVRGTQCHLTVDSDKFVNEGDMFLLCNIINEFIRVHASINSFTELEVTDDNTNENYHWKHQIGRQEVI